MSYLTKLDVSAALPHSPPIEWQEPLVLDLDNTLFRTDLLHESAVLFVRANPLRIVLLLIWMLRGSAYLKARLAERVLPPAHLLPVNQELADYARDAARGGRRVVVATAAARALALHALAPFNFIDTVYASNEGLNLKGGEKARLLRREFPQGFVYAGDSSADRAVWRAAEAGVYAGRSDGLRRWLGSSSRVEADFGQLPLASAKLWARALRVHQWAKNGLVFLPLLLSAKLGFAGAWLQVGMGFLALCAVASATYLINDLADLSEDRRHWSKRRRPIASGDLPIAAAVVAACALLLAGMAIAGLTGGWPVAAMLMLYAGTSLAYSFKLKRVPMLDVTILAALFTLRLAYGAALAQIMLTPWLAAFSLLLFWSLGCAKRATEIERQASLHGQVAAAMNGRGYTHRDLPVVTALGASAAIGATILAIVYLVEAAFPAKLYANPAFLWAFPAVLLLWLSRIWLLCGRGELKDDPVSFAITDKFSLVLGAALVLLFALARAPQWV